MTTKRCSRCGCTWPATAEHFNKMSTARDGLRPECKVCTQDSSSAYYTRNRQTIVDARYQRYYSNQETERERSRERARLQRAKAG